MVSRSSSRCVTGYGPAPSLIPPRPTRCPCVARCSRSGTWGRGSPSARAGVETSHYRQLRETEKGSVLGRHYFLCNASVTAAGRARLSSGRRSRNQTEKTLDRKIGDRKMERKSVQDHNPTFGRDKRNPSHFSVSNFSV